MNLTVLGTAGRDRQLQRKRCACNAIRHVMMESSMDMPLSQHFSSSSLEQHENP